MCLFRRGRDRRAEIQQLTKDGTLPAAPRPPSGLDQLQPPPDRALASFFLWRRIMPSPTLNIKYLSSSPDGILHRLCLHAMLFACIVRSARGGVRLQSPLLLKEPRRCHSRASKFHPN